MLGLLITKVGALVSLLLFEAWFLNPGSDWEFEYEPFIGIVSSIFVLIGAVIAGKKQKEKSDEIIQLKQPSERDVELFRKFTELFSPGYATFFRDQNFLAPFNAEFLNPIFQYSSEWNTPNYEFLDEELEEARQGFFESAEALSMKLSLYTSSGEGGYVSVRPDHLMSCIRSSLCLYSGPFQSHMVEFL